MLVTCNKPRTPVGLQGITENGVSVNVTAVALFNMYVYTRTHDYRFLIRCVHCQEEGLEFVVFLNNLTTLEGCVNSVQSSSSAGRNSFFNTRAPCRAGILLHRSK